MNANATPKRPGRPARGPKYPAALPRTMTTERQRRDVDEAVAERDSTIGEVIRQAVDDGLAFDRAYRRNPGLREDVERMARDAGVTLGEAIETMLSFAVRESRRRTERNAKIAEGVARGFAEMGIQVDGVSVGNVDISAD